MIRHIVIYKVKKEEREKNLNTLWEAVNRVKDQASWKVQTAKDVMDRPEPGRGPIFGDVAMIIDFPSQSEVAGFAGEEIHQELLRRIGPVMESTTIIDIEVEP